MAAVVAGEFAAHLAEVRARDDEKLAWMQSFHARLSEMEMNYRNACQDLQSEKLARRFQQELTNKCETQLQELKKSVEHSSFVLVLVDADADPYIFRDEYYTSDDGGRKAALDIRAGVKEYLGKAKPDLAHLPVIIKAFANEDGLSRLLVRGRIVREANVLREFAKQFSQGCETADFVFVGSGKGRVDKKIESVFKLFIENPTCRHVVFAACHDGDYARTLENYTADPSLVERVTLLHGFKVGREIGALQFRSMRMESVFRSQLVEAVESPSPPASPPASSSDTASSAKPATWAALAQTDGKENTTVNATSTNTVDAGSRLVLVNAAGQRVDSQLRVPSREALESWRRKTRVDRLKFCRVHYLSGHCSGGCGYEHTPLSEGEKLAYRRQLRFEACHVKLQCRDPHCFYGHNCSCKKHTCKFSFEMHNVDVSIVKLWRV